MRNFELPGRSPVRATGAMAATSHPLSTQAAVTVLKAGGNAIDAAVAACAVQCVVEPGSTGIGGDCFVLYAPGGGDDIVAYNGSGRAPADASVDWFRSNGIDEIGEHSPHSVTVPGAVDAWCRLLEDHGRMAIGEVLQPAIGYARDGFPVSDRVAVDWRRNEDLLGRDPTAARIYLPGGGAPEAGTVHRQPELAATLETIAADGRDGFYAGAVADDIVGYLRSLGGAHRPDDFADAQGEYVAPIKTAYKGFDVYECPPNGQGVVALMMLNVLAEIGVGGDDPLAPERLHRAIEVGKWAYRERDAFVSDPATEEVPVERLLSADYAAQLAGRIAGGAASDAAPVDMPAHADTVCLTVVDEDRNAVSFINSLFEPFGSGLVGPRSGVLLQNRGLSFNLDEGHVNCIKPGKRPMHTIIPGILARDGRTVMPFGVMGGHYQAFGHMYLLTNMFDFGLDIQEAIDLPRLYPSRTGSVEVESGMPAKTENALKALGHETTRPTKPIGGAQAIWIDWDEGVLSGGSDPRKDGCAIGY